MKADAPANPDFETVPRETLRTLCVLRVIPLAGMFFAVYFLLQDGVSGLRWEFIFSLLVTFTLVIALTWWRSFMAATVHDGEFFAHLAVDIGIYSLLMFNTGGATNPFVSYLLVPVTIAALALPVTLTWLTGLLCLGSYTLLLFWHVPLPLVSPAHGTSPSHGAPLNLHVIGMWLNFVVSALLIAYFINRMSRTIAAQRQTLYHQQQRQLEDEQLLAVATLAASAAHELGTPLNTMKLIGDDWQQRGVASVDGDFDEELQVLNRQIERCQQTLRKLAAAAREFSDKGDRIRNAREYFSDLLENWRLMRPDVKAEVNVSGGDDDAELHYHPALTASIHNLLNNAGDASPGGVEVQVTWQDENVRLAIRDYGDGLGEHVDGRRLVPSDKPAGMGMGLFLARTILARHRATIAFAPQDSGGTLTTIILPLAIRHD